MRLAFKAAGFIAPLLLTLGLAACTPPSGEAPPTTTTTTTTVPTAWVPPQCWELFAPPPNYGLAYWGPLNAPNNAQETVPGTSCATLLQAFQTVVEAPDSATAITICKSLGLPGNGALSLGAIWIHTPQDAYRCV
jgi:hypothetical protein